MKQGLGAGLGGGLRMPLAPIDARSRYRQVFCDFFGMFAAVQFVHDGVAIDFVRCVCRMTTCPKYHSCHQQRRSHHDCTFLDCHLVS
jgi:hypothetical protein